MILYPIYRLVGEEIDRVVEAKLGTYVLISKDGRVLFVGRADSNLKDVLKRHLPDSETNPELRNAAPHFFYFEHPSFLSEAFERQCILYHQYRPQFNVAHPEKPFPYLKCPVCLE